MAITAKDKQRKYAKARGLLKPRATEFKKTENGICFQFDVKVYNAFDTWSRAKRDETGELIVSFKEYFDQLPFEQKMQIKIEFVK